MINWKIHNLKIFKLFNEISISSLSEKVSTVQLKISLVVNYYSQTYCNVSALKSDINDSIFFKLSVLINGWLDAANQYLPLLLQNIVIVER